MIDESVDHSISKPGAAIYTESSRKKNKSDALRLVMASLAAAAGIHGVLADKQPERDSPPTPRPIVGQPSDEYAHRQSQFVMPTQVSPVAVAPQDVAVDSGVALKVDPQPIVVDQTVAVAQDNPVGTTNEVYLPAIGRDVSGETMEEILLNDDENIEALEEQLDVAEIEPVASPTLATAVATETARSTPEPTSGPHATEDQESVYEIVQKLKEETGISLILIMDFLTPEELGDNVAKEKSAIDDAIQGVLAKAILAIPKKIRSTLPESSKRIIIARNIPDPEYPISPGEVGYLLYPVSNEKGNYMMLDVYDGPTFSDSEDTRLPSDLTPIQELTLATYQAFILDYIHSDASEDEIMPFFMDNLDYPLKNAQNLPEFYIRLGYADVPDVPLDEILARIAALNHIGKYDVIDAVRSLGVLDLSSLPSFQ